jgi:hypothetical protein
MHEALVPPVAPILLSTTIRAGRSLDPQRGGHAPREERHEVVVGDRERPRHARRLAMNSDIRERAETQTAVAVDHDELEMRQVPPGSMPPSARRSASTVMVSGARGNPSSKPGTSASRKGRTSTSGQSAWAVAVRFPARARHQASTTNEVTCETRASIGAPPWATMRRLVQHATALTARHGRPPARGATTRTRPRRRGRRCAPCR